MDPGQLLVIAGPCVVEAPDLMMEVGEKMKQWCFERGIRYIFKSSYTKANRTKAESPSGPGLQDGLRILSHVRERLGVDLLTDVHSADEASAAAEVVQILQVPAFLCRQTPLLQACARACRTINVKKGQFLAPEDMLEAVEKIRRIRPDAEVLLTERGASFGYRNLVVDMRSLVLLRQMPALTIYDATHSLQHPGVGGDRRFARPLTRAALAAGAEGIFLEVHPDPEQALSDQTTQLPLESVPAFLDEMAELRRFLWDRETQSEDEE
ncbi:MAG: 3-deoxy-8-phosphooctulonate synthase [Candidatus Eisenbacteria bacterium]|uniref:3-deoxy-8-phosphooctulonate synthase n=1 Tax=Eiseniibacteriota bacterium TaxID=2212470 RepID=A0A948RUQ5_UNCEI|nr:3-deoxy-8-phosphooctulonate synthase [Candidatus Eisenbacteria bacterium]MBU1947936.1 3-deoxy-8-phosphooctulonate synthase [Candidatus Eisenbacteria bacterium]MBU2689822.1 3-deoxy-8-phosphooctulonate synthase [Candidatus Eisenbacteria bacterium]